MYLTLVTYISNCCMAVEKKENFEKKVFLSLSILLEFNIPNEAYIVIGS